MILTNTQTFDLLKNNMGISMKNTRSADFNADQTDVITNFAVITNVVVKRVHCILVYTFESKVMKSKGYRVL